MTSPPTGTTGATRPATDARPLSPEALPAHFDSAFNRADLDAVLELFDESATMRTTNDQVIETDRVALRAAFERLLALRPQIHNEVRRVLRCDDLALVLMDWTVTTRSSEGQQRVDHGTATQVLKRQADGNWRLKIANPLGVA